MHKHISFSLSDNSPNLNLRKLSKSQGPGAALVASRPIVNSIISNITSTTDAQPTSGIYNTNCPCSGTLGGPGTTCSLCTVAVTFDPKTQSLEERYPSSLRPGLCYPGRDLELTPADRRVLYALAVVNRAFSEPSLDVLWRTQTSLIPLVMSLPDDAYEVGDRGEVRIRRQVEYQDLVRVKHYSHRIKHLISPEPLSFTFRRGRNTSRTVWLSIDTAHSFMESFPSDIILTKVHTLVIPSEVLIQLRPRLLFYVDALHSVTLLITGTDSEGTDTNTEGTQKMSPSWYLSSLVLPLYRLKHFGIALLHPNPPQPSRRTTGTKDTLTDTENEKPTQASSSEEGLTNFIRNFFPPPPQRPPSPDFNGRRLPPAPPAIQYAYHLTCLSFPNITIPTRSLFLLVTTPTATSPATSGIKSLDVRIRPGQLDEVLELWEIEHNDYPRMKYWEERGGYGMQLFQGLEWLRLGVTTLSEPQRFIEKWGENKRIPLRGLKIWRWGETEPSGKLARRDWDYTAFTTTLYRHLDRGTLCHLSMIDETTIKSKALRIRSTFSPSLWHYLLQFHAITSFEICSPSLSLYLSTTPTTSSTLASNIPPAPQTPQVTRPETEELQPQPPATHTFSCFCFTFRSKSPGWRQAPSKRYVHQIPCPLRRIWNTCMYARRLWDRVLR
ncbi:hypothetical protein P691DRAFT_504619 [Macrolepiota fuliginosa MF-IS2]|uniref:Uncharacterized protein n=1 Tax=Macrolepiota fuliginosa MF-IS2 TaxID=1400762 RepID=A0A9P5XGP8_9AGAR|nr:hypothetical protein P691DRAFT_504619 [Macrolepiota fuliginosa MF-IS2]